MKMGLFLLAAAATLGTATLSAPASAQDYHHHHGYHHDDRGDYRARSIENGRRAHWRHMRAVRRHDEQGRRAHWRHMHAVGWHHHHAEHHDGR